MINYYVARAARLLTFAFGRLHYEPGFPWFSTAVKKHLIPLDEALAALRVARFGDVGLHRDRGWFSNLAIPGAMKHAWIHTHDTDSVEGRNGGLITEATQEGVLSKSALTPYLTDYAILLRPRGLTEDQRKGACLRARDIQGADYDTKFVFDLEEQAQFYEAANHIDQAKTELERHQQALSRWDRAFSCSEAVAYCYWHVRETLQLYRRRVLGRDAILPQDYLDFEFDVVWASSSLTVDVARTLGFQEQALAKLEAYHKGIYR